MQRRYEPSKKKIEKGTAEIKASKHPKKVAKKLNEELKEKRKEKK